MRERDVDAAERDEPERAGARLVVFLAGVRLLVRVLDPPREEPLPEELPERAVALDLVLLPDDRGGEPAPEVLA